MKVLFVTGSVPPDKCGVGDYTFRLAQQLAKKRTAKIGILTSRVNGNCDVEKEIDVFPVLTDWRFSRILKVIGLVKAWSPDIIHIQYPTQGYANRLMPFFLPLILKMLGMKVIQTWHEGYSGRNVIKVLLKAIVVREVIVVRPQYKRCLHPILQWLLKKIRFEYIPNASVIHKVDLKEPDILNLRKYYLGQQKRLIVFFGFIYPNKGVELVFEIGNPVTDQIIVAGQIAAYDDYYRSIEDRASSAPWQDKVKITGFLPANDAAALLSIADAVVLPFRVGGGEWNTSIHGAVEQGTFVLTTSKIRHGYDKDLNVYYANVDDIDEMKTALDTYAGCKRTLSNCDVDEWAEIAAKHYSIYESIINE